MVTDKDFPGTLYPVLLGGRINDELERMVVEMVSTLTSGREGFNYSAWYNQWERAA
jgi:hypothetical protein